jgi:hypothetical protein
MFAYVDSSHRPRLTLDYNEHKLTQGKALFIAAFNYWEDQDKLQWSQKLERLQERSLLNERVHKNTAHMTLNFHPQDQLSDRDMKLIAARYLKDIGFADQPALVYRHLDAGHPHLHIVASNIRHDGTRISNDLRSPYHLKQVCQQLEKTHHLTPVRELTPEAQRLRQTPEKHVQRLQYGQGATRTGIENVLGHVLERYAYTSVDHLNAILSRYNVMADRGSEQSRLHQHRGLYYRMLDDEGKRIGAPIKASAFDSRPTLDYLERKFEINQVQVQKKDHQQRITSNVEWHMLKQKEGDPLEKLVNNLQRERILVVMNAPRSRHTQSQDGHGFYYIDFERSTIYRDTDLGERYTAQSIFQRLKLDKTLEELVHKQQLHLTNRKESSILQDTDTGKKLHLWIKLSQQHDQLIRSLEKEQVLKHHKRHHHTIVNEL